MDEHRIDSLARILSTARHRRRVLKTVIVSVALLGGNGSFPASGQEECPGGCPEGHACVGNFCQRPCLTHRDCRSKKKDDPCISNTCVDGYCVEAIVDCQPGYECCRGECCTKACLEDAECAVLDPCRIGRCGEELTCVFTELDPCLLCSADQDCATGGPNTVCCDGACKRPCPIGAIMGKGCECRADSPGTQNGLVVRDDASG